MGSKIAVLKIRRIAMNCAVAQTRYWIERPWAVEEQHGGSTARARATPTGRWPPTAHADNAVPGGRKAHSFEHPDAGACAVVSIFEARHQGHFRRR
jgi:hypothetical protein